VEIDDFHDLLAFSVFYLLLNCLDMDSAQSLNFTAKLKIFFDCFIRKNAKTIYNSQMFTAPCNNLFGIELEIIFMGNSQNQFLYHFKGPLKILAAPQIYKLILIAEKSTLGMTFRWIRIMGFQFIPNDQHRDPEP